MISEQGMGMTGTPGESIFGASLRRHRETAEPHAAAMVDHLRQRCEAYVTVGDDNYIDFVERAAPWWTTRPGGRKLPAAIEHLAAGGPTLGEERYTQAAIDILRTVVEQRIVENCGGTNYGRPYHTWRDNPLDTGASSLGLAIGLDLLRPSLADDEATAFGTYLVPFVDAILDDPPDPDEQRVDWNIALIGYAGTAMLAMVLQRLGVLDDDRYRRSVGAGRHRARLFLDRGHDGDGAFFEGPAYGSASVHYLCPLAYALARNGDRELVEHEGLARIAEGLAYELVPGTGRLNPLNDCGDSVDVGWLTLVAAEQGNGLAQWVWQRVMGFDSTDGPALQTGRHGLESAQVPRMLTFLDAGVKPTAPHDAGCGRVRHFRNRGLVDVRSGWAVDDFLLSFLCDVYPAGGHRQADRGQFSLHALGESFAIDSGYGLEPLPDTTEVLRLGALGEAHNLPLVHGCMQQRGAGDGDGLVHARLEGRVGYLEAELGASYATGWRFRRRVVVLPDADGQPAWIAIVDRAHFELSEPRPMLSWLLHTDAGNEVELVRDTATITGGRRGNRCRVDFATTWPGRWRLETFFGHPRLRYDWFQSSLLCVATLIPYREGEPPPTVKRTGDATGCGVVVDVGGRQTTIAAANADQRVRVGDVETDGEMAVVEHRGSDVSAHLLAGGGWLRAHDAVLVDGPTGDHYELD